MNKITKAWTYGVAYLSLAVGASVSVAGNIADTYRIAGDSGRAPDGLDIFIAGFWPAAVLLVIEMFVSRLWPKKTGPQAIRWTASITFGFIAAYMSWIHLSDLLASRHQPEAVSSLGPLAIDGLAIMATGLILSSRGHKIDGPSLADKVGEAMETIVTGRADAAPYYSAAAEAEGYLAGLSAAVDVDDAPSWRDSLTNRLGGQDEIEASTAAAYPLTATKVAVREVSADAVPAEALELFRAWKAADIKARPTAGDRDALVGAEFLTSPRTARRWWTAVKDAI